MTDASSATNWKAMSGDAALAGSGALTVTKLQGSPVSATAPTLTTQVLKWNGTQWTPAVDATGVTQISVGNGLTAAPGASPITTTGAIGLDATAIAACTSTGDEQDLLERNAAGLRVGPWGRWRGLSAVVNGNVQAGTFANITGVGAQTQALDMGSNLIINLAAPTVAAQAATKGYVDAAVLGEPSRGYP